MKHNKFLFAILVGVLIGLLLIGVYTAYTHPRPHPLRHVPPPETIDFIWGGGSLARPLTQSQSLLTESAPVGSYEQVAAFYGSQDIQASQPLTESPIPFVSSLGDWLENMLNELQERFDAHLDKGK